MHSITFKCDLNVKWRIVVYAFWFTGNAFDQMDTRMKHDLYCIWIRCVNSSYDFYMNWIWFQRICISQDLHMIIIYQSIFMSRVSTAVSLRHLFSTCSVVSEAAVKTLTFSGRGNCWQGSDAGMSTRRTAHGYSPLFSERKHRGGKPQSSGTSSNGRSGKDQRCEAPAKINCIRLRDCVRCGHWVRHREHPVVFFFLT